MSYPTKEEVKKLEERITQVITQYMQNNPRFRNGDKKFVCKDSEFVTWCSEHGCSAYSGYSARMPIAGTDIMIRNEKTSISVDDLICVISRKDGLLVKKSETVWLHSLDELTNHINELIKFEKQVKELRALLAAKEDFI